MMKMNNPLEEQEIIPNYPNRSKPINQNDIIDLIILLNTTFDVDEFLGWI